MTTATAKKMLLGLALFPFSMAIAQAATTPDLVSPVLLTPENGAKLPVKKSAKFTWQAVTGATKYRIIFSANGKFSDYDSKKNKCVSKTACFAALSSKASYSLPAGQAIVAKNGSYFWQVQASNAKSSTKIQTASATSKTVRSFTVAEIKKTGYSKISGNGAELPDTAALGSKPTDWACSKDNAAGLTWEIKTTDGGLRDSNHTYTWYQAKNLDGAKNGGVCQGSACDSDAYIKAVNKQALCGLTNWRLPSYDELKKLLICSGANYGTLNDTTLNGSVCENGSLATVNIVYFPDLNSNSWYWTATSPAVSSYVWLIDFSNSTYVADVKNSTGAVRLVHDAK